MHQPQAPELLRFLLSSMEFHVRHGMMRCISMQALLVNTEGSWANKQFIAYLFFLKMQKILEAMPDSDSKLQCELLNTLNAMYKPADLKLALGRKEDADGAGDQGNDKNEHHDNEAGDKDEVQQGACKRAKLLKLFGEHDPHSESRCSWDLRKLLLTVLCGPFNKNLQIDKITEWGPAAELLKSIDSTRFQVVPS